MKMDNTTRDYSLAPPLWVADRQDARSLRAVRSALSRSYGEGLTTVALCQEATHNGSMFFMGCEIGLLVSAPEPDGKMTFMPVTTLEGDDRTSIGDLMVDMQQSVVSLTSLDVLVSRYNLTRDNYMDWPAQYRLIHLPSISILMWDMGETRAKMFFTHPCSNNPLAAFATLITPPSVSEHGQLTALRGLAEAEQFLPAYFRYAYPNLPIQIEMPKLPQGKLVASV
jgi:hypothetical protein